MNANLATVEHLDAGDIEGMGRSGADNFHKTTTHPVVVSPFSRISRGNSLIVISDTVDRLSKGGIDQ